MALSDRLINALLDAEEWYKANKDELWRGVRAESAAVAAQLYGEVSKTLSSMSKRAKYAAAAIALGTALMYAMPERAATPAEEAAQAEMQMSEAQASGTKSKAPRLEPKLLSWSLEKRLEQLLPPYYRIIHSVAADVDGDSRYDLMFSVSSLLEYDQNLCVYLSSGAQREYPIGGTMSFRDDNENGIDEIYVNSRYGGHEALRIIEFDGKDFQLIGEIPKPKVTKRGLYAIEEEKSDGTLVLLPYNYSGGVFVAGDERIEYPPAAQKLEDEIAHIVSMNRGSNYSEEGLTRAIEQTLASVPPQYGAMALLSARNTPTDLAIALADRIITRGYQQLGYDIPEAIRYDGSGNPYAIDSNGIKRPIRPAPNGTLEYGGLKIWHSPMDGYFYTLDKNGNLQDKFYVTASGDIVYSGPALTPSSSRASPTGDPEPWSDIINKQRKLVSEQGYGNSTTRAYIYGDAGSRAVLHAQYDARVQQARSDLAQNWQRAQSDAAAAGMRFSQSLGGVANGVLSGLGQALGGKKQ